MVREVRRRLTAVSPAAYAITLGTLATYDRRAEFTQVQSPAVLLYGRLLAAAD